MKKIIISALIILIGIVTIWFLREYKKLSVEIAQPIILNNQQQNNKIQQEEAVLSPEKELEVNVLIKDIYKKDNTYYVVLDYITHHDCSVTNDGNGCSAGWYTNENPKLRTFELTKETYISVLKSDNVIKTKVSPEEFYKILKINNKSYYSLSFGKASFPNEGQGFDNVYESDFRIKVLGDKLFNLEQNYVE